MNNITILVVEDEAFILNNICTILEISGYNYLKASNGKQAFEILQDNKPHLIICDVMMPEMDGFELLKLLQSDITTVDIPFCFLSARADIIDVNNGLATGAKAYITKPFLAKELLETVDKIIKTNYFFS